jgi:ribosomal protein S19
MIVQKIPSLRVKSLDIGKTYTVTNGKSTVSLVVTEAMLGFRFGQFVLTKRLGSTIHIKKKARRVQSKKSR